MHEAEHFLSRLDRLAGPEVDIALGLYRDPQMLRAVLGMVSLPESAGRVALSLNDPSLGPFLIVTRDGHFVTCLGTGMNPAPHPVVTRGQLDALSLKVSDLRERLELATRLVGNKERACAQLLRRLVVTPDKVSREDFLAVSAWQPLLAPVLFDIYHGMSVELLDEAPVLRSIRRMDGNVERAMRQYWDLLHAAGHFCLLASMAGEDEHYLDATPNLRRNTYSWGLTSTGVTAFILKGAWGVGRMGKAMLPSYKKSLEEDGALFELYDTIFALLAIGRRSSKLRPEIAKALAAAHERATSPGAQKLRKAINLAPLFGAAVEYMNAADDELEATLLRAGNQMLGGDLDGVPDGERNEAARLLPITHYADGVNDGRKWLITLTMIAATARGAPEQFYFPKEALQSIHMPWKPEFTRHVLEPIRHAEHATRPQVPVRSTPGPNEPCSCGSGRKYKKCCGRPAGAAG